MVEAGVLKEIVREKVRQGMEHSRRNRVKCDFKTLDSKKKVKRSVCYYQAPL